MGFTPITKRSSSNKNGTQQGHVKETSDNQSPPTRDYVFRQMFDQDSFTYTYLLGDLVSKKAILIDPVFDQAQRDMKIVENLQLKLTFVLNTHVHADHVTGSGYLKKLYGRSLQSIISSKSDADADIKVKHGDIILVGGCELEVRHTPGHTKGCITIVFPVGKKAFTGDALLIGGCGRTDFQGGCPKTLYESIHSQIFTLPDYYAVYPAHDYKGRTRSTIGEEKLLNKRLTKPLPEFLDLMDDLHKRIGQPALLNVAVPANRVCGLWNLPPEMEKKLDSLKK